MEKGCTHEGVPQKGDGCHECCKKPISHFQRKGVTNQPLQKEKDCTHEGVPPNGDGCR
ncbi:33872_t:CDS:1, partial [Racocetra persica]